MTKRACLVAGLVTAACAAVSYAGPVQVIDNRSFFANIPHTLIDFETLGDGSPLPDIPPGQIRTILPGEYSSHGALISSTSMGFLSPGIVADPDPGARRAALSLVGSNPHFLIEGLRDAFIRFDFLESVHSVGIVALRINSGGPLTMDLFTEGDNLLDSILFSGSLVDGTTTGADYGFPGQDYEFGYFGAVSLSIPITHVIIHEDLASFDDLRFSVVPEPATFLMFGMVGFFCPRFRRRRTAVSMSLLLVVMASSLPALGGPVQVIDDQSFFDNIPHTLIDFETRGDGTRIPPLEPNHYLTAC